MADDHELWSRIKQGDAHAFEGFYQENARRLLGFLRQMVGKAQAAEDVAQETFMQIWQHPNGFQPDKGTLRAYLFGIGRKRAAEWWRKEGSAAREGTATPPPRSEAGASESAVEHSSLETAGSPVAETSALIRDALERIKPEYRELLWLREAEGLSYAELAEILHVPLGTVRSRLSAAREELWRVWQSGGRKEAKEADV